MTPNQRSPTLTDIAPDGHADGKATLHQQAAQDQLAFRNTDWVDRMRPQEANPTEALTYEVLCADSAATPVYGFL
ncbi:hypothetical protein VB780_08755 [Leptolyngbya sp. CCNP1308]|uniref:hypothetical protein n=1 Tax=Leptolyngbya sp. CCNP1308 TaxID=3110255 RepID=UPI002B22124A|nr:hypothetical protein [Leptolyngbya sp. CCNP1308]MEA5448652.1 hypothetical protein [Leptolyngbya sp. CCNP1308]